MSGGGCAWIERDEIFEQYVRGAIGPEERDAFEAHYFECDACFNRLHASHELRVALSALPSDAPSRQPARAWSWRWVAAPLAATLVVAVSAALWFRKPVIPASPAIVADTPPATVPATAPAEPARNLDVPSLPVDALPSVPVAPASPVHEVRNSASAPAALVLLSPSKDHTCAPDALNVSWSGVPGAAYYEVHIVTEEGNVVWSGKVAGTSTKLPAGHGLLPGQKYFVWVRAHLSGGGTIKSPAVPFHTSGQ